VLAGDSERAAAITAEAAAAGLTGSPRTGADTCVRYRALTGQLTPNELHPLHFAGGPGAIPVARPGPAQR
jgi:hypothetical protein